MKNIFNRLQEIFNWFINKKVNKKQLEVNNQQVLMKHRNDAFDEINKLIKGLNNFNQKLKSVFKDPNAINFAVEVNSTCLVLLENITINLKILENSQMIIDKFPFNISNVIDSILKKTELFAKKKKKCIGYDTDMIDSKSMYYNHDINKLSLVLLNIIIEIINNSKGEKIQIFTHLSQEDCSNIQVVFILYGSAIIDNNLAKQELKNTISYIKSINNFNLGRGFDNNLSLRLYIANKLIKFLNHENVSLMLQQLNIQKIKDHYVYWFKVSLEKLCFHNQMLPQFSSSITRSSTIEEYPWSDWPDPEEKILYHSDGSDEKEKIIYQNNEASSSVSTNSKKVLPKFLL